MALIGNLTDSTTLINDSVEAADSTYSSDKIATLISASHRGVMVYVQTAEPTDQEVNDIWIQI